jgi:hypothetical protein
MKERLKPRKFTLIDAMVLVAATAIGLVPMRYVYADGTLGQTLSAGLGWETLAMISLGSSFVVTPLLVTWSLALWLLRLRQPRPRFRRLFRQAGMAATTAILLTALLVAFKLASVLGVAFLGDSAPSAVSGILLFDILFMYTRSCLTALCDGVLAVWLVLWLARVGRSEASWLDRAGRALGIFSVVYSLLFSRMAFLG